MEDAVLRLTEEQLSLVGSAVSLYRPVTRDGERLKSDILEQINKEARRFDEEDHRNSSRG